MSKKGRKTVARVAAAAGMALAAGATNANSICPDGCEGFGNFVWNDLNMDGIQDAGEPGIDGLDVYLLNDSDNSVIETTQTTGGGYYLFTFNNGFGTFDYKIEFQLKAGYSFSDANQGIDETLDSDANKITGRTGTLSITGIEGQTTINYDIDAGMYVPIPAAVWLFGSGLLGLVGIARRKKAA
jgi:hypothetical protein